MTPQQLIADGWVETSSGQWKKPVHRQLPTSLTLGDIEKLRQPIIKAPDAVEEEAQLHYDILDWCREHGWVALHGSMAKATARTVGELDFTLAAPGGRTFFIECKDRDGKLTTAQQAMIAHLTKLGHKPAVVRSMREFLEAIA